MNSTNLGFVEAVVPDSPQARTVDGSASLVALSLLIDTALASAARLKVERGTRQATVHLHAQFTGAPLRGALRAHARSEGHTAGSAARESLSRGTITAGDAVVCHAAGTFIQLPPPPGVSLATLPWQRDGSEPAVPLKLKNKPLRCRAVCSTTKCPSSASASARVRRNSHRSSAPNASAPNPDWGAVV